jgi:uncharacterized phiE125 gp8 family phage protein
MSLKRVANATSEPVTIDELKHHLRLSTADTSEDTLLTGMIVAARSMAENYTKRQFLPAQWRLALESFPGATCIIELPRPPLSTLSCGTATGVVVTYIKDTTIVDDSTTLVATSYTIDRDSEPGRIYPYYDNEWPSCVTEQKRDAVQITYISGYATVPESIKLWILMKAGDLYENRGALSEQQLYPLGHEFYMGLLDEFVILDFS